MFLPPADPVTEFVFTGEPAFVPGPGGVMTLVNAPRASVDEQLAGAAQAAMSAAAAANAARAPLLRAQLAAVESGLTTVLAATSASDPTSFSSYARLHSEAVEAIEHQHAANVDFRMRRRTWTQSRLDTLATERAGIEQRLNARLADISRYYQTTVTQDWQRRIGTARELDSLSKHRARYLSAWSQAPAVLTDYESAAASYRTLATENAGKLMRDATDGGASGQLDLALLFFQTKAVDYGVLNWWGVANSGLTVARDSATLYVDQANAAALPVIRAMRDMHAKITRELAELNNRQAELYGVLYDMYEAYLSTYGATDSIGRGYSARRAVIAQMLQVPAVVSPRVTVTDFGYLSSISTAWTGTHPQGVYEYLFQDGDDSLFTVGAQGQARRWMYTTNAAGGTVPRNQAVLVRGGAGFTGSTMTPYSVTFRRGSASNPVTQVAVPPVDLTAPSTPVVEFTELSYLTNTNGASEYWTGDSSRVVARWSALPLGQATQLVTQAQVLVSGEALWRSVLQNSSRANSS